MFNIRMNIKSVDKKVMIILLSFESHVPIPDFGCNSFWQFIPKPPKRSTSVAYNTCINDKASEV